MSTRAELQAKAREKLRAEGVDVRVPEECDLIADRLWWIALWLSIPAILAVCYTVYAVWVILRM